MAEYKSWMAENNDSPLKYEDSKIAYTFVKGLLAYCKLPEQVIHKLKRLQKILEHGLSIHFSKAQEHPVEFHQHAASNRRLSAAPDGTQFHIHH